MSRPEHLHVPNTAEGIRRINQKQEYYDSNPERYEREQIRQQEERLLELQREQEEYNQYYRQND